MNPQIEINNSTAMQRAIQLSLDSLEAGGGPFGAVVVQAGRIIGEGTNRVTLSFDPTAHAEIVSVREACRELQQFHLPDCILYTSCEPCPMCLAACYWARISTIYYGNTRADAAQIGFSDDLVYRELARDISERSVSMHQLLNVEASIAFQRWSEADDKTPY